eukprot:2102919-Amphidinium_carterae.1
MAVPRVINSRWHAHPMKTKEKSSGDGLQKVCQSQHQEKRAFDVRNRVCAHLLLRPGCAP